MSRNKAPTVFQIVSAFLVANGYDGLCDPDEPCGCQLSDLAPCSDCICQCVPGYKHVKKDGTWTIETKKEKRDEQ